MSPDNPSGRATERWLRLKLGQMLAQEAFVVLDHAFEPQEFIFRHFARADIDHLRRWCPFRIGVTAIRASGDAIAKVLEICR